MPAVTTHGAGAGIPGDSNGSVESQTSSSQHDSHSSLGIATDPQVATNISDLLHVGSGSSGSDDQGSSGDITGLGNLSLGVAAPTSIDFSNSSHDSSFSSSHGFEGGQEDGGLLGGLL